MRYFYKPLLILFSAVILLFILFAINIVSFLCGGSLIVVALAVIIPSIVLIVYWDLSPEKKTRWVLLAFCIFIMLSAIAFYWYDTPKIETDPIVFWSRSDDFANYAKDILQYPNEYLTGVDLTDYKHHRIAEDLLLEVQYEQVEYSYALNWIENRFEFIEEDERDGTFVYKGKTFKTVKDTSTKYTLIVIFDDDYFQISYLLFEEGSVFGVRYIEFKQDVYDRIKEN